MKKRFYIFLLWMGMVSYLNAQTLLNEDFESCTQLPPSGWSVINDSQAGSYYHWQLTEGLTSALAGKKSAYCNSGSYQYSEPAKEEWLITPELQLTNDTYKLEFKWKGAWAAASKNEYDLQVRITEDDGKTWTQVWSFLNKEQVQKSGVDYPWAAWTIYESVLNLSDYKGKKIKVAFIHNKLIAGPGKGNGAWLDDVLVEKYEPIVNPIVDGSTSYKFENVIIGSSIYSEALILRNIGTDTLYVTGVSGLEGTDFVTTLNPAKVKLGRNQEYAYQVIYTPTITGLRNATLTIQTNGGTHEVRLEGTKKMLPQDYTYEGFEGEVFPPFGWKKTGSWVPYNNGLSGNRSAAVSISTLSELITPRLDLSTGTHTISFEMLEYFEATTDESVGPENYAMVYFSKDGGITWQNIYSNMDLNGIFRKEISLGAPASDNCYVKWSYELDWDMSGGYDEMPEYSDWYIDGVILPPLYGRNNRPDAVSDPIPANGARDVFNHDLKLSWKGALFAKGYKLYVGSSATNFDLVNGLDLGDVTTYTLPRLDYEKSYYWKVVPYNQAGETASPAVWAFTVMSDQTIQNFPYFEGFEGTVFPSLGWGSTQEGFTRWALSNYNPFDGAHSAYSSGSQNNTTAVLQTPEIQLPADYAMQVSFYWGNTVPASLTKAPRWKAPSIIESDTLYFEIKSNDEWHTLAFISDQNKENQKWTRERILLTDYIGQTVNLRWRYSIVNGSRSTGAALDNILIETTAQGSKPVINKSEWDAGIVNYMQSFNSKNIFTLLNDGERDFTITEARFKTSNYISSLAPGMHLASRETVPFSITFNAAQAVGEIKDTLVIRCDDGVMISLPVTGIALDANTRYFGFEEDVFGSTSPLGFTTYDVDGVATCRPVMINYPNYGNPYAYIVMNHKPAPEGADWRNIYPTSGDQVLACMSAQTQGLSVEDWLVSGRMTARTNAKVRFFAKSYGSDFERHKVTVMVSTTNDARNSFTPLASFTNVELPVLEGGAFTEFTADLSQYAGQSVYVALRHTVGYDGFVAFFDDLFFEDFDFETAESHAPVFITEPVQTAQVGKPYTYNFAATDADGDALTYSLVGLPEWLEHTPTLTGGILAGTPVKKGSHMFRIAVTDGTHHVNQDVILTVEDPTGLDGVEEVASGIIYDKTTKQVSVRSDENGSICVYKTDGVLVKELKQCNSMDLSDLNAGIYVVKFTSKKEALAQRVRIE
ncbi:MAG: choice-of-anchor J domain-containing protein [Bacteroidales bacterium]